MLSLTRTLLPCLLATLACGPELRAESTSPLAEPFRNPPKSARPVLWWRFMDDYSTRRGMDADLDAMQKIGLGGAVVSYCASRTGMTLPVEGSPHTPILSESWWKDIGFTLHEAEERKLDLWFQLCPGYATSGGPWITPELSMQKIVWSQTRISAGNPLKGPLPLPKVDPKWNFYRDIAVLAYPDRKAPIPLDSIVEVTTHLDASGNLNWSPSEGSWIVVRLGHTTTGVPVHPVTPAGKGLECDKLSREATRVQFDQFFKKILSQRPPHSSSTVDLFFDSWEAQNQNWTPTFREEFKNRRGYDPLPWLLVATKRIVGNETLSRRFDYDWKTTIEELINDNHFAELIRLSHENGATRLRGQPYNGPVNFMTAGALFDIPEAEYWFNKREYGWWSLRMIASVSHIHGRKIASAESLTSMPANHHMDADPFSTKAQTDLAFTMGINSMAIHATAHNPWPELKPGMTTGFFPPLLGSWQVWNDLASSWITYLSRCCHILQQGQPTADIVRLFRPSQKGDDAIPGYASDLCNEELILSSMTCEEGSLALPSGMRYRILEIPDTTRILNGQLSPSGIERTTSKKPLPQNLSLPLLKKIRTLVLSGATILGPRPSITPGLSGYPQCDAELQTIATELWGPGTSEIIDRRVGKGRVFAGIPVADALARLEIAPDVIPLDDLAWIHRVIDDEDWYFLSNQRNEKLSITASFRVQGKIPDLWFADTGTSTAAPSWNIKDGRTEVNLNLDPRGSVFVRFRPGRLPSLPVKLSPPEIVANQPLAGPWQVHFQPEMGAPATTTFPELVSWPDHPEKGIRYFSGIATYQKKISIPSAKGTVILNLGNVKNLARVTVNGTRFPELWKPPFSCDITEAVKPGENELSIEVCNLWANRLVGDEQEPADVTWDDKHLSAGVQPLANLPEWLLKDAPRPSRQRVAFSTWNYVRKNQKLLPSGLLGPVTIQVERPAASP